MLSYKYLMKVNAFYITEHFIFEENLIPVIGKFLTKERNVLNIDNVFLHHLEGNRLPMFVMVY